MLKPSKGVVVASLFGLSLLMGAGVAVATNAKAVNKKTKIVHIASIKKLNLNIADAKQFQKLKGLGAKKAVLIVKYRQDHGPFKSVMDLSKIRGMSIASVNKLIKNNSNTKLVVSKTKR